MVVVMYILGVLALLFYAYTKYLPFITEVCFNGRCDVYTWCPSFTILCLYQVFIFYYRGLFQWSL